MENLKEKISEFKLWYAFHTIKRYNYDMHTFHLRTFVLVVWCYFKHNYIIINGKCGAAKH